MPSHHLVIWCEAHGCASLYVGPPRDIVGPTATPRGWHQATESEAIAAGWLRHVPLESRSNPSRRERWYCPRCRPARAARPARIEIPEDCPF